MKFWAGRYRFVTRQRILSDFNNPVNTNKSKGSKRDDVPKDEFSGKECNNCKWGKPWTDILHNPDGTEMGSAMG